MKDRLVAMALPFAAGLALVAVVSSIAGLSEAAAVLLGLAVAIGLLGIQLRFDEVDRRSGEQGPALSAALADHAKLVRQQGARLRREIGETRAHLDMLPSDTVNLHRLVGAVAPADTTLPSLGGRSATARSVLAIAEEIRRASSPMTILHLGAGNSTVLDALVLRSTAHGGQVFALEADPEAAEEIRAALDEHGVAQLATVIEAPLVQVKLPDGTGSPWYDLDKLPDLGGVDVLFVDGPSSRAAGLARFPAFPLLADRLKPGALVVLDDTHRPDEKAIVGLWRELEVAGRKLELVRELTRATVMRVVEVRKPEPVKAPAKKSAAKKAPAKRATTTRATTAKKATARTTAKKAPVKATTRASSTRSTTKKAAVPAPVEAPVDGVAAASPLDEWLLKSTEPEAAAVTEAAAAVEPEEASGDAVVEAAEAALEGETAPAQA